MELRVKHRLGAKEIHRRTGVPVSTLHLWLKDYPLAREERIEIIRKSPRYVAPKKPRHLPKGGAKPVGRGLNPVNTGRIGELQTESELLKLNLQVSKGGEGDTVDFYVRRRGSLLTACLQVRTTTPPRQGYGLPSIGLRRARAGSYNPLVPGADFHFLVGFCLENHRHYVYHWKEVEGRRNSIAVSDGALDAWWKVQRWLEGDESWLDVAAAA